MGSDALLATSLERTIVDNVLEMLELNARVDRTVLLVDGILVHDDDDGSTLRDCVCSDCTNTDISQLVVVNPSHVDHSISIGQDLDVVTGDATIGSAIDECTTFRGRMVLGDDDGSARGRGSMVEYLGGQSRVYKEEDSKYETEALTQSMSGPESRRDRRRIFEGMKRHGVCTRLESRFGRLLVQRTGKDGADIRR